MLAHVGEQAVDPPAVDQRLELLALENQERDPADHDVDDQRAAIGELADAVFDRQGLAVGARDGGGDHDVAAHGAGAGYLGFGVQPLAEPVGVEPGEEARQQAAEFVELGRGQAAVADQDEDGIVDCLDPRPFLTASIGKVDVRPAELVSVPLDIAAWWPGVTAYEVRVSFDPAVVEAVGCRPREEAVCVVEDGLVTVFGSPSSPLSGHFRPAYIDFEASDSLSAFSSLQLVVTALSARVPDIGLQLFTEDGSVRISDPGPTLSGDLNCDSRVGPDDVIDVLRATSGGYAPLCLAQGDVNCSGDVDAFDGLAIIAYIAAIAQPSLADCPEIGSSFAPDAEEPE